jgi:hypothetical protein
MDKIKDKNTSLKDAFVLHFEKYQKRMDKMKIFMENSHLIENEHKTNMLHRIGDIQSSIQSLVFNMEELNFEVDNFLIGQGIIEPTTDQEDSLKNYKMEKEVMKQFIVPMILYRQYLESNDNDNDEGNEDEKNEEGNININSYSEART